jgi:integrase/recombinase XerD
MRSFFAHACGKRSPARTLPAPRPKPKLQRTLTAAQAFAVLASCDTQTITGVRDLALLCLMLDTGLRASEICRLKVTDLDRERRRLTVLVKGGKLGDGVYTEYTARQVDVWLVSRGRVAVEGVAELFVAVGGLTPGHSLSGSGLRVIFRRLGKAAGLSAFSPHDLRRTFATLTIRNGAPTRLVQLAGRWDDLALLERYTVALEASDIEQYLPVGRLMGL